MKRYLPFIALGAFIAVGYGCKKKPTPLSFPTAKMESGTYVWMGGHYSYDLGGGDVFIEVPINVVTSNSVAVGGDTLQFLRRDSAKHQIVFGYDKGNVHRPDRKTLSYDENQNTFQYSYA